jgi:catechol 2,3-dioxygenase-like lactoylglutathione lyase family enzyme
LLIIIFIERITHNKINPMPQHIAHIAIVVNDYNEAIEFYTKKLGFNLLEDTQLSDTKRWVKVSPPGNGTCSLLLAKAANDEQLSRVGNQTGGRVFLFLYTDDFWRDFNDYTTKGVQFVREPVKEPYGTVAVFEDLYGNLWDMIEPVKE